MSKDFTLSLKDLTVGFVGGGQMAEAIFAGALNAGALRAAQVHVADADQERLNALAERYGVAVYPNGPGNAGAQAVAAACRLVVLCVKPQLAPAVVAPLDEALAQGQTVLSIMGGTTLAALESWLPNSRVVRAMPNTSMRVGKGCAGLAGGSQATEVDLARCERLFGALGLCERLPESQMDALTAVSGCGPAFAYLFIEALADGGVEQGLPRAMAQRLAAQTLAGAAAMVLQTGQHPAQLKDSVCSPGGGTIAGVHALEAGGFRAAVLNAVEQSRRRMQALGQADKTK